MVLRRRGGDPYPFGVAKQATVRRDCGKWYCSVAYETPDSDVADNGLAVGIDRNVGQITLSTGEFIHLPNTACYEARLRRYQRMMMRRKKGSKRREKARHLCARTYRKLCCARRDWSHQTSRRIADGFGTVCMEALDTKKMTRSAKGTAKAPGSGVRAKARLNAKILNSAWGSLRNDLAYKAARLIEVPAAYTSQTCHECGHMDAASRRSQAKFHCVHCGREGNADVNAALNVLASGTGAAGRGRGVAVGHPNDPSIGFQVGVRLPMNISSSVFLRDNKFLYKSR